jgi:hypothetical protein
MKRFSEEIAKYVFLTNVRYTNKQNKTKEIFFKYLEENKTPQEFEKEISKIWDNINHSFMDQQIKKLQKMVNKEDVTQAINLGRMYRTPSYKDTDYWLIDNEYFKLTPESEFIRFEEKYKRNVVRNYERSQITMQNYDKDLYLKSKIDTYNKSVNQVVTYFSKEGTPLRKVQLSTYLSMLHNTDLTRGAWNQTMSDAEILGATRFIIPFHPFCCPECFYYMNRPLSLFEVQEFALGGLEIDYGELLEGGIHGNILHPNCKCTLSIYWSDTQIQSITNTSLEIEEQYKIRQKVNGLTLEKSNLRTDIRIAKELGEYDKVDKYKARISTINRNIRELRNTLPTEALQKQVTAIKR